MQLAISYQVIPDSIGFDESIEGRFSAIEMSLRKRSRIKSKEAETLTRTSSLQLKVNCRSGLAYRLSNEKQSNLELAFKTEF